MLARLPAPCFAPAREPAMGLSLLTLTAGLHSVDSIFRISCFAFRSACAAASSCRTVDSIARIRCAYCVGDSQVARSSRGGDRDRRGSAPLSMKKGVKSLPSVVAALLMANSASARGLSQSSLRTWASARNVSLMTPLARSSGSTLALVLLWNSKPRMSY